MAYSLQILGSRMHTDRTSGALVYVALTSLAAFAFACGGGGSSPAAPTPQPQPTPAAAPTITGVSPGSGPTSGGLGVTITGTGFTAGATVSIGGTLVAGAAVATSTSITATTPAHAAGAADIVVTNPDGQSSRLAGGFTFDVPVIAPPALAGIAPTSGSTSGGSVVTITGTGFVSGATVSFGSSAATAVTVVGPGSITATAPARSAGSVDVVVANPDGQSSRLTGAFTYVGSAPPPPPPPAAVAPTVTAIAPASATTAGGTAVTLTGTGFAAGAAVSIGGTAASSVVVASATSITATTPPHAAGSVDVVVTNADGLTGRLTGGFSYTAPAPPPPPPSTVVVITITTAGVTPSTLSITAGTRVRFVNNDTLAHTMSSDPHPDHTQCPGLNAVGLLLPGQSRESDALTTIRTCGYHDHNDPDDPKWTGTIQIR
jgi:plastocyanin